MGNKNTKNISSNGLWSKNLDDLEQILQKIHNIIEETETQYYIHYLQTIKDYTRDLSKKSDLQSDWYKMEEPKRSKLFRLHVYSNKNITKWWKYLIPQIEKLNLDETWKLYTFFYPDADRSTDFFNELENYDGWLESWKWEKPVQSIQFRYYKGRVDVKHLFGNVESLLRYKILKNKFYYLQTISK